MSAERGIGDPPPLVASALEGWIEQHRALGHQVVRVEPGDPRHTHGRRDPRGTATATGSGAS
jgi:hypothetical protein